MRRGRHRHVSALMIVGSALGTGLGGGILATRPSGGVHQALAPPYQRTVPAPGGAAPARLAASVRVPAAGRAEPDGSLFTLSGSWPVISGLASDPSGGGYWLTAADGLFSFGGAGFSGSLSGRDRSGTFSVSGDGSGYDEVQRDKSVWTFTPGHPPATSRLPVAAAETVAAKAVAVALSEVGKPYVYGASGPNSFDCSGLVQYAYRRAGVALPRSTQQQLAATRPVPAADLHPGDLVFFYPGATHVGIYLGDGTMVDAPHTGATVRVEPIRYFGPMVAVTSPVV